LIAIFNFISSSKNYPLIYYFCYNITYKLFFREELNYFKQNNKTKGNNLNKLIMLIPLCYLTLYGSDNIWSKDTPSISKEKSQKIIKAYESGDTSTLNFENDPELKKKNFNFKENVFVIGFGLGYGSHSEKLSNTTGSETFSYSSLNTKIIVGKDFTMWNEEYTQPTRIYLSYLYTKLDSDVTYTTVGLGITENMRYFPLYKSASFTLYPTLSFELAQSSLSRDTLSATGLTTEINLGLAYTRDDNFEYYVNLFANSINWNHPVDGIADEMSGFGLYFGLNYKLNYGDY